MKYDIIRIMQNEVEKMLNQLGSMGECEGEDEKIIALELALNTYYKMKSTRSAYERNTKKQDGAEQEHAQPKVKERKGSAKVSDVVAVLSEAEKRSKASEGE